MQVLLSRLGNCFLWLAVAALAALPLPGAGQVTAGAVNTRHAAQGNKDINGDGEAADDALLVYDTTTRQVWNPGLAGTSIQMAGDWIAVVTPEAAQGNKDLNGDGDTGDEVGILVNVANHQLLDT